MDIEEFYLELYDNKKQIIILENNPLILFGFCKICDLDDKNDNEIYKEINSTSM